jgi:menaquinone-9 beta-reductase
MGTDCRTRPAPPALCGTLARLQEPPKPVEVTVRDERHQTDVVVVGGGPAGLAAAIAARLQGLRVVVLEAAHPPIDKVCGEGLMPEALAALRRLGVSLTPEHGTPFVGLRFVDGARSVDARFPSDIGVGIRRPLLHHALVERAHEVGVAIHWDTPVQAVAPSVVQSKKLSVAYRWLIAADGLHSAMRRWTGLNQVAVERKRLGFQRHYRVPPWSGLAEIHWTQHCQACITPVGPEEVCVCLLTTDTRVRFHDLFALFPQVAAHLEGAAPTTAVRGAVTGTRRLARVYRDKVALIGDASGGVDAIAGAGLCLAFQQAEPLGKALAIGDLALYASAHRGLARRPGLMASLMLLMDSRPWLRRWAMRVLTAEPACFARLVALHVGQRVPPTCGWQALLARALDRCL